MGRSRVKHPDIDDRKQEMKSGEEPSRSIRAVTFDVGGTLIQPWPSVGHVYAEVAARHGLGELPVDQLNRQFNAAWKAHHPFDHQREGWARIVDLSFEGLCAEPPSRTFFQELYEHFGEPGAWRVFEDVLPTLEDLKKRGIRLAIISNWDERLRPLLRRLHLDGWFEVVVVSHEVGVVKPSPAIFREALRQLNLPPSEMLHIGDSEHADVKGARAAGMSAVRIERSSKTASPGCIRSLQETASLLSNPCDEQAD